MYKFHGIVLLLWVGLSASAALSIPQSGTDEVLVEALDGSRQLEPLEELWIPTWPAETARLRFLSAAPAKATPLADGFVLELVNGDRVHGKVIGGGEEKLRLEVLGKARVSFPIESFRSLMSAADLPRSAELVAPESGDRLWRRVGDAYDRIDGLLIGFGDAGLTFEGQLGEREYPWAEVAGLWIEILMATNPVANAPAQVSVDLTDGTRLRGEFLGVGEGVLTLGTASGERVSLPVETLLEIDLDDERLRFVSGLDFASVGSEGLFGDEFGMRFPPRRDASVLGGPLSANGVRYARGIGVHAPSRLGLDWTAGGILRGAIAVDDSARRTAAAGSVRFRIYLDGELAFESAELTSKGTALELPALSLEGKERVEFEVDPASNSVMGDRANWLDLRITRG